jgi:uncharacterized protein with HEPN domain
MRPEIKDSGLLYDIVYAAADTENFVRGSDFESFSSNKMLRYAVERHFLL